MLLSVKQQEATMNCQPSLRKEQEKAHKKYENIKQNELVKKEKKQSPWIRTSIAHTRNGSTEENVLNDTLRWLI